LRFQFFANLRKIAISSNGRFGIPNQKFPVFYFGTRFEAIDVDLRTNCFATRTE
jgi:hypothetical protein